MGYIATDALQEGLNALCAAFPPVAFVWSGATYNGLDAVTEPIFDTLGPGGITQNDQRTIFVPRYQPSGQPTFQNDTPPSEGDTITIGSVSYSIKRKIINPPGLSYSFEVEQ